VTELDYLGLLRRVDELYASVVTEPERWTDDMYSEWAAEAIGGNAPSKPLARELRRALRVAQRLRTFWLDDTGRPADRGDWRTRVDIAQGPKAWRPTLEIARIGLDEAPSEELFEEVRERFRVIHSDRWMEEVTFSQWRAEHGH
jgi:hypothetical protein